MSEWWEDRSIAQKVIMGIGLGLLIVGAMALFGVVTRALWNWLMPEIFGLPQITYWQTVGLLLLSCIFFKNFGSDSSGKRSDRRRKRHLRHYMSDEPGPADTGKDESQDGGGEPVIQS
ncbi:MAG: hypothetical protein HN368_08785 [Spirochaetales bacterium]|jgi:hypothetical protein|nr:hypothetical protein [Spirochaetales bacterium]